MVLLSVCLLSVSALAADRAQYEFTDENGNTYFDENSYNAAVAAEKIAAAGIDLDADAYWSVDWLGNSYFIQEAFEAAYTAAVEKLAAQQQNAKNGGTSHGTATSTASGQADTVSASDDRYPVGAFVDEDGNVFSAEGQLLHTGDPSAVSADSVDPAEGEVLVGSDVVTDVEILTTIAELVSDINDDTPTYHVLDLRPTDTTVVVSDGLKALVISIFGEYHPVTTTALVSETVGDDVYQYCIETVAAGAAGVDYEWVAGVFLFGILLYCLMKLLGGVLK